MLRDSTNRRAAATGDASSSHTVLPVGPGQAVPWADFGKLRVGQSKVHTVVVKNITAEDQELSLLPPGEGFQVLDSAGKAGAEWAVPAGGSIALLVVFMPQREGRVREVLAFQFGDGSEAGRLAVSAVALGAGPVGTVPAAAARPLPRPAFARPQPPTAPVPQQQPAQQAAPREKRQRAAARLATPRSQPVAAAASTPSLQPAKKARDVGGAGLRTGAKAPDPATPTHVVMRQSDKPLGSVEEATPGAEPPTSLVPRLQLSRLRESPGAAPSLGSSRFAQELAAAQGQHGTLGSSRLGGTPTHMTAACLASAAPKTFTHFHTSRWMDKQETAFKAWLNTILLPAAPEHVDAGQNALASRRLAAKVRGLLWRIYRQDEQLRDVVLRVEERVMGGQLRMKDPEACLKNLQAQARVKTALLSYHPFWLRLGMEVVVGRSAASGDAVLSSADLELFMRYWFLRDPDLAKQHAPNKAVNGLYTKSYWVQLGNLVLSRLLLLVALLDRAMAGPVLPQGVPLLFNLRSKIKGSAQVLQAILPDWLSGEGDVLRSLSRLGYRLQFEQQPKREVSFAVSNLAVDLRDGLRLCKLADILLGGSELFEQARFPADKRPVKLHNVQLALGEFLHAGLSLDGMKTLKGMCSLQPVDLIDGDREKTLSFLWRLILRFQLPQLVDTTAVRMEIERIGSGGNPSSSGGVLSSSLPSASQCNDHVGLLLEWVQTVCAQYCVTAHNFTSSFANGQLFCLLINFYLGNAYLPVNEIYVPGLPLQPPQSPASCHNSDEDDSLEDAGWQAQAGGDPAAAARHRQGVAHNFELVHRVAEALGNIPMMVSATDILELGPDEKAVVLFTAFLCQRLLEMSKEERAAMVVQRLWRRRQLQRPGMVRAHLHRWIAAAAVVQRAVRVWLLRKGLQQFGHRHRCCIAAVTRLQAMWRARPARQQFLQLRHAALCIQAAYRGKMERRRVFHELVVPSLLAKALQQKRQVERSRYQGRLLAAAVSLQALRRGSVQRRAFMRMRSAAVTLQAAVRCHQARCSFQRLRAAAVVLQKFWHRRQALQLLQRTKAAIIVQKHFRGHTVRRELAAQHAAATTVQAAWRAYRQQQSFQRQRQAAIMVQAAFRSWVTCRRYCMIRQGAIVVQRHWRGFITRHSILQQHKAAVVIQAAWRCHSQRRAFQELKGAAILLQSLFRRKAGMQQLSAARQAAVTIQRHVRGALARAAFERQRRVAVRLQAWWRSILARQQFRRQRQAAVLLQAHVRGMQAHAQYRRLKAAAVWLQSAWRARQARLLLKRHRAALAVQRLWRGYTVRRDVAWQRAAAVKLQAAWRCHSARSSFLRLRQAVVVVQTALRRHAARQAFLQQRAAAVAIQAGWRGHQARQLARRIRAAITLQAAWRARQAQLLLKQHKAARSIQRLWRGYTVRRDVARQRAAAVKLQAAWRCHSARSSFLRLRQAAIVVQAAARMAAARTYFQRQRAAAVAIQAAWRGFATRRFIQRTQAAVVVQRHVRGFLHRRLMSRKLAAAVVIQRKFRWYMDRKRQLAIEAMTRQMRELAAAMQLYTQRMAAALRIQSAWRGHVARVQYAAMVAEHQERLRLQRKREAAALLVIAPWAAVFRDRTWFLRARKAVRVLQRWWHGEHARRVAAATKLQAAARCFLAVRQLQGSKQAAAQIQAAWRGHHVRASHPKAKRLAEIRRRLARAYSNAQGMAHRSLAARTRVALGSLLSSTHLTAAAPCLESLALCTEASRSCCDAVAAAGGMAALLRLAQSAGRDKTCHDGLRWALLCLAHMCRYRPYAEEAFRQEGLLGALADQLQHHRDKEDVFLAAAQLLQRLVADPGRAQAVSRQPEVLSKYEGVHRVLTLRLQQEHKYLQKLEGQKGSDASARQSTSALVRLFRQAHALQKVLDTIGAPSVAAAPAKGPPCSPGDEAVGLGKNTIVRSTLRALQGDR